MIYTNITKANGYQAEDAIFISRGVLVTLGEGEIWPLDVHYIVSVSVFITACAIATIFVR